MLTTGESKQKRSFRKCEVIKISHTKVTRYDSSLSTCVKTLLSFISSEVLSKSVVIRDINGQLGIIVPTELGETDKEKLTDALISNLGSYARPYALVTDISGFDASSLLSEGQNQPSVAVDGQSIHVLDRRVVGMDWLKAPAVSLSGAIPLIVFASIKGGVGRSTALCVAAAHLSRRGQRVLAIDFDLEAPGIGSMLLKRNELPQFGSLDFMVESQVGGFKAMCVEDLIGSSYLGSAGARVDVIPAIGSVTLEYPQNALGKIARAYLEMQPDDEGPLITLGDKLNRLVQLCIATGRYDVILVDSRAGLHESTAASMLALGGEVLLFGTNQPQTFQGYTLLFSHLAQFAVDPIDDWRERLNFVHAMSSPTEESKKEATDRFVDIYRLLISNAVLEKEDSHSNITADDINIVWADTFDGNPVEDIPDCQVLHILDDRNYQDFDPLAKRGLLEIASYEHTYEELIAYLDQITANVGTLSK